MTTEQLMVGSAIVSTIATVVIAIYTVISHCLTKTIQADAKHRDEKANSLLVRHHQELADLYQALVIATLESGVGQSSNMKPLIETFEKYYTGVTKIFGENPQRQN
jgi:hypothetical protein